MSKQLLQYDAMYLGKRIELRLNQLEWTRSQLLDAVDGLTPQALSNLITRDSRRSEWDVAIANALGVTLMWLVYGDDNECHTLRDSAKGVYEIMSPQTRAVIEIMGGLDISRQEEVLAYASERQTLQRSGAQNSTQRAGQ